MKRTTMVLLAVAALLGSAPARADDVEQAKTLFNAGAQAYGAGKFAAAIQAFAEAYKLAPRPALLFSMAQAHKKQFFVAKDRADLKHAIELYREYLQKVETGGRRSDAADALAELEPMAMRLDALVPVAPAPSPSPSPAAPAAEEKTRLMVSSSTERARVFLDARPPAEVPLVEEVAPGKHHVRVVADGYFDEEREIVCAKGGLVALDLPLRERPGELSVVTEPSAEIHLDGRLIGTTPLARPILVPPGNHFVSVLKNGRKGWSGDVSVGRGAKVSVQAPLATTGQRTASLVVLGAGAAAAVAGGVFLGVSLGQESKAQGILDAKATRNLDPGELGSYARAVDRRDAWRTVSVVTLAGAGALMASGLILFLFDRPAPQVAPEASAPKPGAPAPTQPRDTMEVAGAPLVGPGLFGAAAVGRF